MLADSDDEDSGGKKSGGGNALAMIEKLKLHLDVQGEQLAEELNGAEVTFIFCSPEHHFFLQAAFGV